HAYPFLSFHSSRTPRHLHSFPTRRSSDLVHPERLVELAEEVHDAGGRKRHRHLGLPSWRHVPIDLEGGNGEAVEGSRLVLDHQGDRKSTRLNSSHVSISYAVFCLKKKRQA